MTVVVDEGDHRLNGRSSSAWAKYAEALRRISLAWRSSRFSRSSAFSRSATSPGGPSAAAEPAPPPRSDRFIQSRNVSAVQPIFAEIDASAAQRVAYSASCSGAIRTARSRISGENLFVVLLVM